MPLLCLHGESQCSSFSLQSKVGGSGHDIFPIVCTWSATHHKENGILSRMPLPLYPVIGSVLGTTLYWMTDYGSFIDREWLWSVQRRRLPGIYQRYQRITSIKHSALWAITLRQYIAVHYNNAFYFIAYAVSVKHFRYSIEALFNLTACVFTCLDATQPCLMSEHSDSSKVI